MKISTKGRYGLAAILYIAKNSKNGEFITVIRIADELGFSKIYLEQIFSMLKKAKILVSIKGSQGGYQLAKDPCLITVLDVLQSTESSLCEKTEIALPKRDCVLEKTLQEHVFKNLHNQIKCTLSSITIEDLVNEAENCDINSNYMYFI